MLASASADADADSRELKRIEIEKRGHDVAYEAEQYLRTRQESDSMTERDNEIEQSLAKMGPLLESGGEPLQKAADDLHRMIEEVESANRSSLMNIFSTNNPPLSSFFGPLPGKQSAPPRQSAPRGERTTNAAPDAAKGEEERKASQSLHSIGKVFGGATFSPDPKLCFVLMPFEEKLKVIYIDHIKPTISALGLTCVRADDVFGTRQVVIDIWESINRAKVIVADLTGRNANVFYEVGLAHAVGKDVVLISQTMDDVPFDLKALRCIVYEYTPRGMKELEQKLKATITKLAAVEQSSTSGSS